MTERERGYLAGLARKALGRHEDKMARLPRTVKDPADLPRVRCQAERYREFLRGVVEKTEPWNRQHQDGDQGGRS